MSAEGSGSQAVAGVTRHAQVRFVPNVLSGEYVVVGVVAWRADEVTAVWASSWERAVAFAAGRITPDAVRAVLDSTRAFFERNPGAALVCGAQWFGAVQLGDSLPSLLAPDATAAEVAARIGLA